MSCALTVIFSCFQKHHGRCTERSDGGGVAKTGVEPGSSLLYFVLYFSSSITKQFVVRHCGGCVQNYFGSSLAQSY